MKRCLPIFLLLLSVSAYGALNKWVDAEGNVHYSDQTPPPDVKAQTLAVPAAPKDVPAQKTIIEQEAERKKNLKAAEEAAQKAAAQQEETLSKQKNCDALRANLTSLEKNAPVYIKNPKGEDVLIDDAARQQQIETTRKAISEGCN